MRSGAQIKVLGGVRCTDQGALMRSDAQIKVLDKVRCTDQGA